ncbi:MAG: hypothetical protein QM783_15160 [Phycisphaerales bacterium]
MLKLILSVGAVGMMVTAAEPSMRGTRTGASSPEPPKKAPTPPPPPPMPSAGDCWRDFIVGVQSCQHEFEGTDRIQVALRRTAMSGAGAALNSCLNLVPGSSPPTETPEAPIGSRAYTCLEQIMLDVKECRTKFSPGVISAQADPDRDTMKNAFDQCLGGAMSKNGWCNGRKPNNPMQTAQVNLLEGPALASDRSSVTFTVAHTGAKPVNIYWYAAIYDRRANLMREQRLGMTPNVPCAPTALTLPLEEPVTAESDVIVLGKSEGNEPPVGGTGG